MLVSPFTDKVRITLVPSIVAFITLLSLPDAPDIVIPAPVASAVSPTSMSRSFEEPTQTIEAVTEAHELTVPPLSQLKSMSLLLPVVFSINHNLHLHKSFARLHILLLFV